MPDEVGTQTTEEAPATETPVAEPLDGAQASGDPEFVDPESPARAEAGRAPRGAPPA